MKKLLTIFFLLWSICSFGQFGWNNLSSNQWVSFTDAQGSGIITKQALPSIAKWMSKSDCINYLSVVSDSLSGYTSSQWVTKNDLYNARYSPTYYSYWLSYESYSSASEICNTYTLHCNTLVYSADSVLVVGSQLWSNTTLTTAYTSLTSWRGALSSRTSNICVVTASSGNTLTGAVDCSTIDYHMYIASQAGYSSAETACGNTSSPGDTIYCADATLTASSTLFYDTALTMPYSDENDYNTYKWIHPIENSGDVYSYFTGDESNTTTNLTQCISYGLTVSPSDFYTDSSLENSFYVEYTSDSNTYTVTTDDEWLTPSVSSITGSGSFYISLSVNSTGNYRVGTVNISLYNVILTTISIYQGAN